MYFLFTIDKILQYALAQVIDLIQIFLELCICAGMTAEILQKSSNISVLPSPYHPENNCTDCKTGSGPVTDPGDLSPDRTPFCNQRNCFQGGTVKVTQKYHCFSSEFPLSYQRKCIIREIFESNR